MLRLNIHIIFITILLIIFSTVSYSQDTTYNERPKIGIVLSGGAAKGLAHIGVLKVMERAGLKPDIVTGTSMGSIVGSLYAIGFSPQQIEIIFTNIDWSELFSDAVSFEAINLEEKHDYEKNFMSFYLDDDLNPYLPQAAVHGQKIHQMLMEILWPAIGHTDFTQYPRPFACVSTDLLTGKHVVFTKGDLSSAVRSSMSIPSAFAPMPIDSMLLIDGGITRNLPVQEAKDLGADYIIGVYTSFDTTITKDKLKSVDDIIIRTAAFVGINDAKEQSKLANILITPDLKNYSADSYKKVHEIIQAGEKAAMEHFDTFKKLADSLNAIAPPKKIKPLGFNQKIYITDIGVKGNENVSINYIKYIAGLSTFKYYDSHTLSNCLEQLYGTLLFHRIYYTFEEIENGFKIWFHVIERPTKEINIALNHSNFFGPSLNPTITARHLISNDKLKIPLVISENPIVGFEYEKFAGKRRASMIKMGFQLERSTFRHTNFENNSLKSSGKYIHLHQNANIGLFKGLSRSSFISARLNKNTSLLYLKEGLKDKFGFYKTKQYSLSPELWAGHVSLNKRFYPSKGMYTMIHAYTTLNNQSEYHSDSINTISFEKLYSRVTADFRLYSKLNNSTSTLVEVTTGFSDNPPLFFDKYFIGGYELSKRKNTFNFIGLAPYSIITNNFLISRLHIQKEFKRNILIQLIGNAGAFSDNSYFSLADINKVVYGGGVCASYNSIIGPISVTAAYTTLSSDVVWHVNIGYPF